LAAAVAAVFVQQYDMYMAECHAGNNRDHFFSAVVAAPMSTTALAMAAAFWAARIIVI
jgi:hypothetical protein